MMRVFKLSSLSLLLLASACGDDEIPGADVGTVDTGIAVDLGAPRDLGTRPDASADSGFDAGAADLGRVDADPSDLGPLDDAGVEDTGPEDAGTDDAEALDQGEGDASVFFTLTVSTSTGGSVVSVPGSINCFEAAGACAEDYSEGITVTLTASAATDFAFDGWTGDCLGQGPVAQVVMDADRSCAVSFLGTQGEVALVSPPSSVIPNQTEDPTNILIFPERTGVTLPAGVPFDVHVPDTYGVTHPENTGDLPAGQVVNVYFLHFDPVGTALTHRTATLTFPGRIVALITKTNTLFATDDLLGLPGQVLYPSAGTHPDRGLEDGNQDAIVLSADRRQLSIDFETSTSSDQIRIVTIPLATPVPFMSSRNASLLSAPLSVALGATESSTRATVFLESANLTLTAPLSTDISVPGVVQSPGGLTPGTIPSGTAVSSYLVHFDPVGGALTSLEGSLSFDRPILGLIGQIATLDASDPVLGASGTTYPTGAEPDRAMEWAATMDWVRFSSDGRSLRFRLHASTGSDQLRVILAP